MTFYSAGTLLRYVAANDTGVIASGLAARIYPERLPQNPTLPAAAYYEVADDIVSTIDGAGSLFIGLVEIEIYATTKAIADECEEALRLALQGYQGVVYGQKIGIEYIESHSGFAAEITNYVKVARYRIYHRRANPARFTS